MTRLSPLIVILFLTAGGLKDDVVLPALSLQTLVVIWLVCIVVTFQPDFLIERKTFDFTTVRDGEENPRPTHFPGSASSEADGAQTQPKSRTCSTLGSFISIY